MIILSIPFPVFIAATKMIAALGPVGLPVTISVILFLTARGIPTTIRDVKRILRGRGYLA